jgi:hypothetical protein
MLNRVIQRLAADPYSRRAYIPIFQPGDCFLDGKDIPCNVGISFYIRNGQLDMTVFNRSNDMIWGAYGANVVHFSFLQEYVAGALGIPVGYYAQISSNFHIYTEFDITKRLIGKVDPMPVNPYETGIRPSLHRILDSAAEISDWQSDAQYFIDGFTTFEQMSPDELDAIAPDWLTPFFAKVVAPMYRVWHAFVKEKDTIKAMDIAGTVDADDWRVAALQWMNNRLEAREHAKADRSRNTGTV